MFRKLPPNRIARMQVLVDASVLLCAYAVCLSVLLAIGFLLLPRELCNCRVFLRPVVVGIRAGLPPLSRSRASSRLHRLAGIRRLHDSELFYASLASAVAFVVITATGVRKLPPKLFSRPS